MRQTPRETEPPREPSPDDMARRERALLLRSFETSTLTKANFCVLKRIAEAELDAQLAQARSEREQRAKDAPPAPADARGRPDHAPRQDRQDRPGRHDRPARRPQPSR